MSDVAGGTFRQKEIAIDVLVRGKGDHLNCAMSDIYDVWLNIIFKAGKLQFVK